MSQLSRLTSVYKNSKVLPLKPVSKYVLMSDAHRGDGSLADNFNKNSNIFFAALTKYHSHGYTYIELGDGDELWENKSIEEIIKANRDIFWKLSELYRAKRLHFIYGNHDIVKKHKICKFSTFYDDLKQSSQPLFPKMEAHEGLILRNSLNGREVFLVHGHQGDLLCDTLWPLGRFMSRYLWRPLQLLGIADPFSVTRNHKRTNKLEKGLRKWADENDIIVVAGHTHETVFPDKSESAYFNDGCCVYTNSITAIEIQRLQISLVKWRLMTRRDGTLFVGKQVLRQPVDLDEFYKSEAVLH